MWVPLRELGPQTLARGVTVRAPWPLFLVDRGGFIGMSPHMGWDLARAGPELRVIVCELGRDPLQGH